MTPPPNAGMPLRGDRLLWGSERKFRGLLESAPEPVLRGRLERIAAHFLTQEGKARVGGTLYGFLAIDPGPNGPARPSKSTVRPAKARASP